MRRLQAEDGTLNEGGALRVPSTFFDFQFSGIRLIYFKEFKPTFALRHDVEPCQNLIFSSQETLLSSSLFGPGLSYLKYWIA
jgi:hypothetical protein